jgi:sulfotransferase
MSTKTYHFMAGLPRSGSTLLKSILDQNPNIHANPVSPVMELMYHTEEYFKRSEQYQGYPKPQNAYKIISSYIDNYYYEREEEVIVDHCRAWPNNIERIKTYITPNPKIICPVRDILEILTSFITMVHRNEEQVSFIDQHLIEKGVTVDDDNRCQYLMSDDGIVEQALWSLSQAFVKNDTRHLLIVEYDDLVNTPDETMRRIYDFLELDYYCHDFNNVENKHRENDDQWYLKDMHYVRKKVKKISKDPKEILSPFILNKYKKLEYWKYPDNLYLRNVGNK